MIYSRQQTVDSRQENESREYTVNSREGEKGRQYMVDSIKEGKISRR